MCCYQDECLEDLNVKVCREGGGMSDNILVEARLKLVGGWTSAGSKECVRNVLKVSELNNSVKKMAYQESLRGKYEVWRGGEVESVEREWEKFRDIVMECTNGVCGMRRIGGQRRKGSEWWNEGVGRAMAKKRREFEEWLQRRDRLTYDSCRLINSLSIILQKDLYNKSSTVNIYVYDCHINHIYICINLRIILLHVILLYCSM